MKGPNMVKSKKVLNHCTLACIPIDLTNLEFFFGKLKSSDQTPCLCSPTYLVTGIERKVSFTKVQVFAPDQLGVYKTVFVIVVL